MKHLFLFALLLSAAIFSSDALAQAWQQTNGTGGDGIISMTVNPQGHIFIVSHGLYRSTDGGVSWKRLFLSAKIDEIVYIAVQPSGRLILSTQHYNYNYSDFIWDNMYVSDDDGNSWKHLQIAAGYFWQGAGGVLFAKDTNSYVKSTDDGNTWSSVLTTGVSGDITSLFSDNAGHLFISADFVYRSTDNGTSWAKILNGLPNLPLTAGTNLIQAKNGDIFAVVNGSVYQSTDGGRTWIQFSILPYSNGSVHTFLIDKAGNMFYTDYERIVFSSDNGDSWVSIQQSGLVSWTVENSGSFLYSLTGEFLRWVPLSSLHVRLGATNGRIASLVAHPDGSIISFNANTMIWLSSDKGNSWTQTGVSTTIATAIDSSKDILAGSSGSIISSSDSGKTWKVNSPNLTTGAISGLAVRFNGNIFASSTIEGVFRSTDRGVTWDQLNSGISNQSIFSLAVHQNGDVYAGSQNIIYKSTDVGLHWSQLTTNFPNTAGNISAMVVSTQGNIIAGVDNAGVFWSTDNGATWAQRGTGLTASKINALVSTPSGKVFAATNSGIFFLDIIPGANWIQLNSGLTATNVLSLCRDQSGRLFAGTDVSGVFSSIQTYNIAHQSSLNAPSLISPANNSVNTPLAITLTWNTIPNATKYQVSISRSADFSTVDAISGYLRSDTFSFAAKEQTQYYWHVQALNDADVSLFSDSWTFTSGTNADVKENNFSSSLSIFPNPAQDEIEVAVQTPYAHDATIEIYDALGAKVYSDKTYMSYGTSTAHIDTKNLSRGVYLLKIGSASQSFVKAK